MKYQLFLQSRSAECGLACAAMILRRLGIDTDLHQLRTQYEVGRDGMSTTAIRFLLLDFNVPSFQHKGGSGSSVRPSNRGNRLWSMLTVTTSALSKASTPDGCGSPTPAAAASK